MEGAPFRLDIVQGLPNVVHQQRGHDCPGTPDFQPEVGLWVCSSCDWTSPITSEDCHICGNDADSPPHPLPRDQFISFNDPQIKKLLSMHTSCAIQIYLALRYSVDDEDKKPSGGGIP